MCGAQMTEAKRFAVYIVMLWVDLVLFRWLTGQLASVNDVAPLIECRNAERLRRIGDWADCLLVE